MNHWRLNVIATGGEGWGVGGATSEGRGEGTGSPPIRAQADRSSVLHPQPWGEGRSPVDVGVETEACGNSPIASVFSVKQEAGSSAKGGVGQHSGPAWGQWR